MNPQLNILLNLLYPPKCIFCGTRLAPTVSKEVCHNCANTLPYCRRYTRCSHCGKPISDFSGNMCKRCSLSRHYTKRVTSAFIYADNAKSAVISFKKEYNASLAKTLSLYVAEMIKYDFGGVEFDFVTSAPPRKKNFTDEKFDHAAYLAKAVAHRIKVPYKKNLLYQTEKLKKQSELSPEERFANVKGKFAVRHPDTVQGKTVLIIDDVHTTGATLEECASSLLKCGAHKVYGATAATTILDNV